MSCLCGKTASPWKDAEGNHHHVGRTNVRELQDDPAYKDVYAALSVSEQLVASERAHQRDAWDVESHVAMIKYLLRRHRYVPTNVASLLGTTTYLGMTAAEKVAAVKAAHVVDECERENDREQLKHIMALRRMRRTRFEHLLSDDTFYANMKPDDRERIRQAAEEADCECNELMHNVLQVYEYRHLARHVAHLTRLLADSEYTVILEGMSPKEQAAALEEAARADAETAKSDSWRDAVAVRKLLHVTHVGMVKDEAGYEAQKDS